MSEPAITPPSGGDTGGAEDTGVGAVSGLRDLDARGVVAAIVASRRAADAYEARLLALAVHFVDLHPVVAGRRAASWDPEEKLPVVSRLRPERKRAPRGLRHRRHSRHLCGRPHRPH